jgi:hypothetical protein
VGAAGAVSTHTPLCGGLCTQVGYKCTHDYYYCYLVTETVAVVRFRPGQTHRGSDTCAHRQQRHLPLTMAQLCASPLCLSHCDSMLSEVDWTHGKWALGIAIHPNGTHNIDTPPLSSNVRLPLSPAACLPECQLCAVGVFVFCFPQHNSHLCLACFSASVYLQPACWSASGVQWRPPEGPRHHCLPGQVCQQETQGGCLWLVPVACGAAALVAMSGYGSSCGAVDQTVCSCRAYVVLQ